MEFEDILDKVMQLPDSQKNMLANEIKNWFMKSKRDNRKRQCEAKLHEYIDIMSDAIGISPSEVLRKDRLTIHVHARWVIWDRRFRDGFSQNMMAKASGFGHNIVQIGMRRIEEIKENPRYDPSLSRIYELFNTKLENVKIS